MFEHAGSRDRALLRDVADDEDGGARGLGESHELRGALPKLRNSARRRRDVGRLHRLNRIHDQQRSLAVTGEPANRLEVGLGNNCQAGRGHSQPVRPQADLLYRLLTAGVQHGSGSRNMCGNLQQQSGFADARVASQEGHRARHEPAPEDPIQLLLAGSEPRYRTREG